MAIGNLGFVVLHVLAIFVTQGFSYVRVCYFTSWSQNRAAPRARISMDDINADLCTHVVYAFATLDTTSKTIVDSSDQFYQFNQLKLRNPNLKTLLSIGGENAATNTILTQNTKSEAFISQFSKDVASLLRRYGFDGFDVDWEFPNTNTKSQYTALIKGLREEFDDVGVGQQRLLLTAAVSAGEPVIKAGYDVPEISKHLDYIFVMTYDFFGSWSQITGFNSPLYKRSDPRFSTLYNVDHALSVWIGGGADPGKVVMGTTGIGVSFTLTDSNNHGVGSAVKSGGGPPGEIFQMTGRLAYAEICLNLANGWTRIWDEEQQVPYAYNGKIWVGYDDTESMERKAVYIREHGLAGVMFWELSLDDPSDECETGPFPLLRSLSDALNSTANFTTIRNNILTTWRPDWNIRPNTKGDNSVRETNAAADVFEPYFNVLYIPALSSILLCIY